MIWRLTGINFLFWVIAGEVLKKDGGVNCQSQVIITRSRPVFERVYKLYDKLNGVVRENLHGNRVVKAFGGKNSVCYCSPAFCDTQCGCDSGN